MEIKTRIFDNEFMFAYPFSVGCDNIMINYLGGVKAWLDSLPKELSNSLEVNGTILELYIKNILNSELTLKDNYPFNFDPKSDDWFSGYSKLMYYVASYGNYFSFCEEKFEEFWTFDEALIIKEFAKGYHKAILNISKLVGYSLNVTITEEEELLRNWEYFFKEDFFDYSLEGIFIPLHKHSYGYKLLSCTSNIGLYNAIRSRDVKTEIEEFEFVLF